MNEVKVKPCPFCGSEINERKYPSKGPTGYGWKVMCECCSAQIQQFKKSDEGKIGYWNTRPIEDGLRARIAELEEELRWIPVEEKLPEKYRDDETGELIPFLACTKKAELPFRALYDGTQWGDGMFPVEVTHWKPLPGLPEESEK